MQSIIMHLDMNSYFASVEQQDCPQYRGVPLGVCEHLGGIIIAASKEAKKWGIKTGTPVWEAKKLYPKIILTQTHAERYRFYTKKFVNLLSDYTDKVELASIDEAYIDVTACCNIKIPNNKYQNLKSKNQSDRQYLQSDPFEEAIKIVQIIKRRMKTEVGDWLTCSVGIAENKLLAKIGSDMQKPDGLTLISNNKYQISNEQSKTLFFSKEELYQKLKLIDIPGIGHRQEKRLNAMGIKTLLDLKNYPQSSLERVFGIQGRHLHNMGQLEGSFKAKVHSETEIKSIGHMYTLPKEYRRPEFFEPVLYKLCEMVGRRLRNKNLQGNILYCFIRSSEKGKSVGASKNLGCYVWDGRDIFLQAKEILKPLCSGGYYPPVKLIGVTVAGLRVIDGQQSLFGAEERQRKTVEALDKINSKYGEFTVFRAPVLKAGKVFRDSVGFGREKEM